MSKATINLTGSLVVDEIDLFLETYPEEHPYRIALARPEFRRKFVAWVLKRIPNRYAPLEDDRGRPVYPDFQCASLEKRLKIEEIIIQGIQEVLDEETRSWQDEGLSE